MLYRIFLSVICLVLFYCCRNTPPEQALLSYNYHIRPILSDKCFACHGPDENKREANLRLDIETHAKSELTEHPGSFAIHPKQLAESEIIKRIKTSDASLVMPPVESNLVLTEQEKQLLEQWILQGAEYEDHWAFIPPERSDLPKVKKRNWPTNEIDHFILAKMEANKLSPNPKASKEQLLKRISLDLTGLPPSPEIQEEFMSNQSEGAVDQLIDRLFQSPHYGEQMAVPWLDAARYADSHGYQDDGLRTMWPWRDWVIHSFNENYSFEKFVTMQLAGDLLDNPTKEDLLATGFNRNHKITQEGGVIDEEYRIEYVTDRTNTYAKTFLALTFECAKCHDHKFDPITQKDYFSTFAFFDKVPEKGIFGTIDASFADPPNMEITEQDIHDILSFVNKKDTAKLMVMIMQDSVGIRSTHVLGRGNYDEKEQEVNQNLPDVIFPFDTTQYPQNRLGLVKWMFHDDHPLTARVFINRLWKQFMGNALVTTEGDFGMQGDLPTHPELLDWLAVEFKESHWDIQHMIKLILSSSTYRQSSEVDPKKVQIDPTNRHYARMNRVRLSAENVRDHVLASSGLLNEEIGGESVKPYQPEGLWLAATSGRGLLKEYQPDTGQDLYRRGMYTFIKRTVPPPVMLTFDASPRDQCEVRRLPTSTPLQALVMLNDPTVLEASRFLAEDIAIKRLGETAGIQYAAKRILCRELGIDELKEVTAFLESQKLFYKQQQELAGEIIKIGDHQPAPTVKPEEIAPWMQVVHLLYNMEEAIVKV